MRKRLYFVFLVVLLIVCLLTLTTNAASLSFTTTMTPSSTSVSESTEVVVTVAVSNLNVGDSGINAFSAYLSYDSDVFETLTSSSVEALNSWSATYETSSGQILLLKNSFVNDDEDIMQINLKVKSGVDDGTTGTIKLTNVQVSNSEEDISGDNVSTTITVGTSSSLNILVNNNTSNTSGNTSNTIQINTTNNSTTNNTTNNATTNNTANNTSNSTTNNATNNTSNNTSNNSTSNNTSSGTTNNSSNSSTYNNTSTDSDSDIPYTGTTSEALMKIILGVIIVALLIYFKMRKMDDIK